jgi:hypothetical protein
MPYKSRHTKDNLVIPQGTYKTGISLYFKGKKAIFFYKNTLFYTLYTYVGVIWE